MHLCFNPPASPACLVKSSLVMNGLSVVFLLVLSKPELIMSMGRRIMVVAAVAAGRAAGNGVSSSGAGGYKMVRLSGAYLLLVLLVLAPTWSPPSTSPSCWG